MDPLPKLRVLLAAIACFCGMPLGAPGKEPSPEPLILRAYSAPLGMFTTADPESKDGKRRTLDLKKYFEARGIPFGPGSDAVYDTSAQCLMVRQTVKNMEQLESLFAINNDGLPTQVQCEISVYRVSPALAASLARKGNLSPETFKQLEKDGHLLDRLLGMAQSGQITELSKRNGDDRNQLQVEPLIGTDGSTIDITFSYQLKLSPRKEGPVELALKSQAHVEDGHSVIVQTAVVPSNIAVVLRASIVNSCGWVLEEVYDR